jgi:hypothetical protein
MLPHLNPLLDRLGLQTKPRYTLEETADILGIRRDQILDLLKRGKLTGVRASERRWGGVIAVDLDDYLGRVNAPRERRGQLITTEGIRPGAISPGVVIPPAMHPMESVEVPTPPIPGTPIIHDLSDMGGANEVPVPPVRIPKPSLGF